MEWNFRLNALAKHSNPGLHQGRSTLQPQTNDPYSPTRALGAIAFRPSPAVRLDNIDRAAQSVEALLEVPFGVVGTGGALWHIMGDRLESGDATSTPSVACLQRSAQLEMVQLRQASLRGSPRSAVNSFGPGDGLCASIATARRREGT